VDELVHELMSAVALRVASGLVSPIETEERAADGEWDGSFSGYASTSDPDHDAWIIPAEAWSEGMGLYMRNPVGLYNHDFDRIVSRTIGFQIDQRGLRNQSRMNLKNSFAAERAQELRDGFLGAQSVQFIPIEEPKILDGKLVFPKVQLLEISLVSVPANPYALLDQRSAERVMGWARKSYVPPPEVGPAAAPKLRFADEMRIRRMVAEMIDDRLGELARARQEKIAAALDAIGSVFDREAAPAA
jgi:HK97 family phage prohead protease